MNWLAQPLAWPDAGSLSDTVKRWREGAWREAVMWPVGVLLTCATFLFALSAFGVWLLWPSHGQAIAELTWAQQALQTQVQTQRQRLNTLRLQAAPLADSAQALSDAQRAWPTAAQAQPLLMALHLQTQKQGLQLTSFKPEGTLSSQGFSIQSVNLRLHGSFSQIVAWTDALFEQGALWVPEKWTLSAQPVVQAYTLAGVQADKQADKQAGKQVGRGSGTPAQGPVSLEALLHLYLRPDDNGALQAAVKQDAFGQAWGEAGQTALAKAGSSPPTDPFSRPVPRLQETLEPYSQPQDDRVHPLIRWPVHDLKMVGSFSSRGVSYALVQTPAGLFQVAVGDVLGAEAARVAGLDEDQITLRLRFRQGNGRWAERQDALSIQRSTTP